MEFHREDPLSFIFAFYFLELGKSWWKGFYLSLFLTAREHQRQPGNRKNFFEDFETAFSEIHMWPSSHVTF